MKSQNLIGKYFGCYIRIKDTCFDCIHLKEGEILHYCNKKDGINKKNLRFIPLPHKMLKCMYFQVRK